MGNCCRKKKVNQTNPEDQNQENDITQQDISMSPSKVQSLNKNQTLYIIESNEEFRKQLEEMEKRRVDQEKYQQLMAQELEKKRIQEELQKELLNRMKNIQKNQNFDTDRNATSSYYASHKFLPINIRQLYKTKFSHLPQPPPKAKDQVKELFMTLNIARDSPIYFSNNVLEAIRDRIHVDNFYYSFCLGILPTVEGIAAMDSLMTFLSKSQKLQGLKWNHKLENLIDQDEIRNMNVFNTNIFEMQDDYENKLKEILISQYTFVYEHLRVLIDYNTTFGFEIVANQLRDDGNDEKDVRELLLSPQISQIYCEHLTHVTNHKITLIILTSEEITKDEYLRILKANKDREQQMQQPNFERQATQAVEKQYLKPKPNDISMNSEINETADATLIQQQIQQTNKEQVGFDNEYNETQSEMPKLNDQFLGSPQKDHKYNSALISPKENKSNQLDKLATINPYAQQSENKAHQSQDSQVKSNLRKSSSPTNKNVSFSEQPYDVRNSGSPQFRISPKQQNNITNPFLLQKQQTIAQQSQEELKRPLDAQEKYDVEKNVNDIMGYRFNQNSSKRLMKITFSALIIISVLFVQAQAGCNVVLGYADYIRGFTLGLQQNFTDTNGTCFKQGNQSAEQIDFIVQAFHELEAETLFVPLDDYMSHLVKLSDAYLACDGPKYLSKMRMRLGTWSGALEFLFNYAWSFIFQEELALVWEALGENEDCMEFGMKVGRILSLSVNLEVHEKVFYEEARSFITGF